MKILKWLYEKKNKKPAPYYYDYSIWTIIAKPFRKWITNTIASNCPFNNVRIFLYRLCGFKIGKNVFIGMHSYLDDMCYDLLTIGDDVIISYGVYFACHGRNQGHYPITVKNKAYIGMRSNVISKNTDGSERGVCIGEGAVVGACTLVNRDVPDGMTAVGIPCRIIEGKGEQNG
ncbi:acyltransferase [Ruminococcus flavefaciens]|uniref:acyltransferase n=1 Tax=Ruminococcus flavefaciens TaxID=1265 RepID=UPI0026EF7A33|nr:acyltransferase [Ruminococcus flavefaciens]